MEKEIKLQVNKSLDNFYLPIKKSGKYEIMMGGIPVKIEYNQRKNLLLVDVWRWGNDWADKRENYQTTKKLT